MNIYTITAMNIPRSKQKIRYTAMKKTTVILEIKKEADYFGGSINYLSYNT